MNLNKWLIVALIAIWAAVLAIPDNKLHLIFCDVGQGDAVLIKKGTNQLLVDAGPGKAVLECLSRHMPFYDRRIEGIVVTHDNTDHAKGVSYVQERYRVIRIERNLTKGQVIKIGDVRLEIVWPENSSDREENDQGIVGVLDYGGFEALLTADVASDFYPNIKDLEVVKVPHHGSKTGWDPDWWKAAMPKLAVISVGKNSFGHPTTEVLGTMTEAKIEIKRTDKDGDVEIISDGKKWRIK